MQIFGIFATIRVFFQVVLPFTSFYVDIIKLRHTCKATACKAITVFRFEKLNISFDKNNHSLVGV